MYIYYTQHHVTQGYFHTSVYSMLFLFLHLLHTPLSLLPLLLVPSVSQTVWGLLSHKHAWFTPVFFTPFLSSCSHSDLTQSFILHRTHCCILGATCSNSFQFYFSYLHLWDSHKNIVAEHSEYCACTHTHTYTHTIQTSKSQAHSRQTSFTFDLLSPD